MGAFDGDTPDEAIEAMRRDAGYAGSAETAEVLGESVESLRADLIVEAVSCGALANEPRDDTTR